MTNKVQETLLERHKVHGEFEANAAIAQQLKEVLHTSKGYQASSSECREAMDQICSKLSRWCSNPMPEAIDNWIDIAGYATLAMRSVRREKDETV